MKVAMIGAGAAGCFCAVNLKRMMPSADITVYERGNRPMAKLAITGGGRCNLTNTFRDVTDLAQVYPRGSRLMQRLFRQFSPEDTQAWWREAGVELVVQDDQCIFPRSQDAMQVVGTLARGMREAGVKLLTGRRVREVSPGSVCCGTTAAYQTKGCEGSTSGRATYQTKGSEGTTSGRAACQTKGSEGATNGRAAYQTGDSEATTDTEHYDTIVVTTGGSPRAEGLGFLSPLGLDIEPPVPSLFALNTGDDGLHALSGTVVADTPVAIAGTRLKAEGPLLITHFGMSGPAILRLSSYGARHLAEQDYRVTLSVNWMQGQNEEQTRHWLEGNAKSERRVASLHPQHLAQRHWEYLLQRASIPDTRRWDSLNRKELNRLVAVLTADLYPTSGRRQYKAEFVTCGGIALRNINLNTLALKNHPNIYLAGEVLDVDAVTGGFNLQAAWTMGYVVARSIAQAHRIN